MDTRRLSLGALGEWAKAGGWLRSECWPKKRGATSGRLLEARGDVFLRRTYNYIDKGF